MNVQQVLAENVKMAHHLLNTYLSDLTTDDLFRRPSGAANHIAYQLGHLIVSADGILKAIDKEVAPELLENFADSYRKDMAKEDAPGKFHSKETYLNIFQRQKEASLAVIERCVESDLDKPAPESMRHYCPTIGNAILLLGSHILLHVGQIVVLRRELKKPILI